MSGWRPALSLARRLPINSQRSFIFPLWPPPPPPPPIGPERRPTSYIETTFAGPTQPERRPPARLV